MSWTAVSDETGNWRLFDDDKIYGCKGKGMIIHGFKNRDAAVKWIEERRAAEQEAPDG